MDGHLNSFCNEVRFAIINNEVNLISAIKAAEYKSYDYDCFSIDPKRHNFIPLQGGRIEDLVIEGIKKPLIVSSRLNESNIYRHIEYVSPIQKIANFVLDRTT